MIPQDGPWAKYQSAPQTAPAPTAAPGVIYGRPKQMEPGEAERLRMAQQDQERQNMMAPLQMQSLQATVANSQNQQNQNQVNNASKFRDDYNQNPSVVSFTKVLPKYVAALKQADNTPAGDLAITYAYASMMEPQSAVREGEQAMIGGGDTLYGQVVARLNKERGDGGTFRPEYRKQLLEQMRKAGNELRVSYDAQRQRYADLATRAGINPEDVVGHDPARDYGDFEYQFWNDGKKPGEIPPPALAPSGGDGGIDRSTIRAVSPGPGQIAPSTTVKTVEHPGLKAVAPELGSMVAQGAKDEDILGFLQQKGIDPATTNIQDILRYRKTADYRLWKKQNPNAAYPIDTTKEVPLTKEEQRNAADALTPLAAGVVGAANAGTAGFADEIYGGVNALATGKPLDQSIAEADRQKNLIREANPAAFMAGEVAGGVAAQLGVGKALGAAEGTLGALAPRAIAGDVAYGSAYGAGENNEDRVTGAVKGGALSAAGGIGGRGAARVLGGIVAPNVDPAVRTLRDKGVRTTLGQSLGPRAAQTEEKLASIPLIGGLIKGARETSINDFQKAVVNDALAPIGKKLPKEADPIASMKFAQKAFDDAYADARAGMALKPDVEMVSDLQRLEQEVLNGGLDEASAKRLRKIYDGQVARRLKPGGVSGSTYKEMSSALGKLRAGTRQANPELSNAIGDMQAIIDRAARRSSPPEAVAKMDAADQGYALFVRAEDAAAKRGGETGGFSPLQYDAAVQKADGSVRSKAYLRGEAKGQELAEAGKKVLRDRIPNSGTPERVMAAGLLGGGGYAVPIPAAIGAGGLAAAYAPGVRDVLTKAITRKSPAQLEKFADWLRKRSRVTGAAASPLLLSYKGSER